MTEVKIKAPRKPKAPKLTEADYRRDTCAICPLKEFKCQDKPFDGEKDIFIIAESHVKTLTYYFDHSLKTKQVDLVECSEFGEKVAKETMWACVGRKMNMIEQYKPKVVVTVGFKAFKEIEKSLGNDTAGEAYFIALPCEYKGHKFWHYSIPEKNYMDHIQNSIRSIQYAVTQDPDMERGDINGIEFVTDNSEIDPAFDWLEQQEIIAFDLETTGLSPFRSNPAILSISIGTKERIFAFPLYHPQTPSTFDVDHVLKRLWDLPKKVPMIAHNAVFELDWIGKTMPKFEYQGVFHDTQAQAYLTVGPRVSKSLDSCIRRHFGFNLKQMSPIDVANLINEPLADVLSYNALDVKYTHALYEIQKPIVAVEGLNHIYETQLSRIPPVVVMRRKGLYVDVRMVQRLAKEVQAAFTEAEDNLLAIPEIVAFIAANGSFNFQSSPQIRKLMYDYCGISREEFTSFDEEHFKLIRHPVAKAIIGVRKLAKLYSTYLLPYLTDEEEGGDGICDDSKIHSSINTLRTVTSRLSSNAPNIFNFPKRGASKRFRNIIVVPDGYKFVACDYASVEYKMIANISEDQEMISAINNGRDIHGFWGQRLIQEFPGVFVRANNTAICLKGDDFDGVCPCEVCETKAFRDVAKGMFVFALCFGSSIKSVAEKLHLTKRKHVLQLTDIIKKDFYGHHVGLKNWQDRLHKELDNKGYILNPFGRKFRAPLSHNELINYPIQSTASDIVNAAMVKLARQSYDLNEPDLAPVLNLYDDLSFYFPEDRIEELLVYVMDAMLDTQDYPWMKVPLEVEVSTGNSWGALDKMGLLSSRDWGK